MSEEVLHKPVDTIKLEDVEPKVVIGENIPNSFENSNYAGFFPRLLARLIDIIIYFFIVLILGVVLSPLSKSISGIDDQDINKFVALRQERIQNLLSENKLSFVDIFNPKILYNCDEYADEEKILCNKNLDYYNHSALINSILNLIVWVMYFVGQQSSKWQASLGKKMLNLKVANSNNKQISFIQGFAREFFWIFYIFVSILNLVVPSNFKYVISSISAISLFLLLSSGFKVFFNEKRRSLHDDIADTYVLRKSTEF